MIALSRAGICAPSVPNVSLANRGNGIPYFVPIWEFNWIGTRMITLPNATFKTESHGDTPIAISPDARDKDGIQIDIPTQSIVMLYVVQLLSEIEVGAKSSL